MEDPPVNICPACIDRIANDSGETKDVICDELTRLNYRLEGVLEEKCQQDHEPCCLNKDDPVWEKNMRNVKGVAFFAENWKGYRPRDLKTIFENRNINEKDMSCQCFGEEDFYINEKILCFLYCRHLMDCPRAIENKAIVSMARKTNKPLAFLSQNLIHKAFKVEHSDNFARIIFSIFYVPNYLSLLAPEWDTSLMTLRLASFRIYPTRSGLITYFRKLIKEKIELLHHYCYRYYKNPYARVYKGKYHRFLRNCKTPNTIFQCFLELSDVSNEREINDIVRQLHGQYRDSSIPIRNVIW